MFLVVEQPGPFWGELRVADLLRLSRVSGTIISLTKTLGVFEWLCFFVR